MVKYIKDNDGKDTVFIEDKDLNTEPAFFQLWTHEEKNHELARLNRILLQASQDLEDMSDNLERIKKLIEGE